ncbi:hypothetical protein Cgig2_022139 [Carnegiea gigantea]|uniref:Amine oxidase domain-containing protein n=1 Tax=Carnegiea gigantea TaxID=171969 RepID=A0A9Q1K1R8_9CARY|nr:hypothetical protein Cgig2_022139 [Carnegiea gigantea]
MLSLFDFSTLWMNIPPYANKVTYPNMMELFENLGVDMEASDMSFSVSLDQGRGCEWGSRNGLSGLFAQKSNAMNPYFLNMIREIVKFNDDVILYLEELENNPDIDRTETLGHFVKSRGYSELFQKAYLVRVLMPILASQNVPMCASIWSCASDTVMNFSAHSILSFCRNHHLLQVHSKTCQLTFFPALPFLNTLTLLFGRPQWLTVRGRSHRYVNKVIEELEVRGCQIKTNCEVHFVSTSDEGCTISCSDGSQDVYDGCIIAAHAPDAIRILGEEATHDERRILGAFQYVYSDIYLHHDKTFMPQNSAAWSAWNFLGNTDSKVCLTYWLNVLQNISETSQPFLVTLNPPHPPENMLLNWSTGHPVPSVAATKASLELNSIQGKRGIWFCGAYQGYGFHEDGLKDDLQFRIYVRCSLMCGVLLTIASQAGISAGNGLLGRSSRMLTNPKQMVSSWKETAACLFVTRFLRRFISAGCLILLEEGGTILTFEGSSKQCNLKVSLRIHNPHFYWKVAIEADLGLADAFINGDFSFVDKHEGLLNLFMIIITNRDLNSVAPSVNKKRGWWTPMLLTAGIASARYFYNHVSRRNTLAQARRNISRHYDLSNEMFSLFMDETMTFDQFFHLLFDALQSENEDLKVAQMRKISHIIEKARVEKHHEVLEIGCGWGSLAIEVVRQTGCRYTGITLSEEQLKFAQQRVKEAGLQDHIRFLLCDYRQLPEVHKYDRIISWSVLSPFSPLSYWEEGRDFEMLEAVGHEYMEEFFQSCESHLAANGLLVLQCGAPGEHRHTLLSNAKMLEKELFGEPRVRVGLGFRAENHVWMYFPTPEIHKIISLGFNDKLIRTWEYYFDYCAAGFKTRTLGNYQLSGDFRNGTPWG